MTSKEFFLALDELEKEKGIAKEKVIESLETALAIACKKNFGEASRVVVRTNPDKFTIRAYICKTVVAEVEIPENDFYVGVQFHPEFAKSKNPTKSATKY